MASCFCVDAVSLGCGSSKASFCGFCEWAGVDLNCFMHASVMYISICYNTYSDAFSHARALLPALHYAYFSLPLHKFCNTRTTKCVTHWNTVLCWLDRLSWVFSRNANTGNKGLIARCRLLPLQHHCSLGGPGHHDRLRWHLDTVCVRVGVGVSVWVWVWVCVSLPVWVCTVCVCVYVFVCERKISSADASIRRC